MATYGHNGHATNHCSNSNRSVGHRLKAAGGRRRWQTTSEERGPGETTPTDMELNQQEVRRKIGRFMKIYEDS